MLEYLGICTKTVEDSAEYKKKRFRQVVWNNQLFTWLLVAVMRNICCEVERRKRASTSGPLFEEGEQVVLVAFALRRLKDPFELLVSSALADSHFLDIFGLQARDLAPGIVSVRTANDMTGPTLCTPMLSATHATGGSPARIGQKIRICNGRVSKQAPGPCTSC